MTPVRNKRESLSQQIGSKYSENSSDYENDANSDSYMDTDNSSMFISFSDLIKGTKKTKNKSKWAIMW